MAATVINNAVKCLGLRDIKSSKTATLVADATR